MKLKHLISGAAQVLGMQDVVQLVEQNASNQILCENANYNILTRCANLVIANITSNYIDCVTTQKMYVIGNKIEFSKFSQNVLKIKSVVKNGIEEDFELFVGYITVPDGLLEITYSYVPAFSNSDEDVSIPNVTESTLVYGILSEYAFISGMLNEAKIWNEKFESFLFSATYKGKNTVLPVC